MSVSSQLGTSTGQWNSRGSRAEPHWGAADAAGWLALTARWGEVAARTLGALEALSPADLEAPPATAIRPEFRASLATRRAFWAGHVFHVAYHLGQVGCLRAGLGLGWGPWARNGAE